MKLKLLRYGCGCVGFPPEKGANPIILVYCGHAEAMEFREVEVLEENLLKATPVDYGEARRIMYQINDMITSGRKSQRTQATVPSTINGDSERKDC